jgi:4,5-dihydroxyphthalate decarboxylase
MKKLNLSFACWDYDRTRALQDGRVSIDGIDLNYLSLPVEETFYRQARFQEFDISEMSLSSYCVGLARAKAAGMPSPFVALPIFPSRFFRHSCIYVNADAGINEPKDLIGKRIASPEYQMTAPVWIRGILQDHYGVPVTGQDFWYGGEEETGRIEKLKLQLPDNIRVQPIRDDQTLTSMLHSGEIAALYTARMPSSFLRGDGKVKRLFENYAEVELDYYRKTKIFPIMHTVVMKRSTYEANSWIAQSLTKAFMAAQQITYADLHETAALKTMLPWLMAHVEETKRELGDDWWSYGVDKNKHVLETFLRYHHEQGLSPSKLEVADLFAPEALESFKI